MGKPPVDLCPLPVHTPVTTVAALRLLLRLLLRLTLPRLLDGLGLRLTLLGLLARIPLLLLLLVLAFRAPLLTLFAPLLVPELAAFLLRLTASAIALLALLHRGRCTVCCGCSLRGNCSSDHRQANGREGGAS
ncbi:hypothetical protein [Alteripontixanthobacter muriae]|uniref:hypothetical protein n=1 Tax=Alteripontixanthobacter muriae TaxID=2705546 RepID=UPI001E4E27CB|nr:hypothetical protein [Alteripontixanthobacter muriae]